MLKTLDQYTELENKKLELIEAELKEKYPHLVEGTILAGDCDLTPEHLRGKVNVEIACIECGESRRIAIQDLFQVKRCVEHTKAHQRANRAAKRRAKRNNPDSLQARKAKLEAELLEVNEALAAIIETETT